MALYPDLDQSLVAELRTLISSLAAKNTRVIDVAMAELLQAAGAYRASFPIVDGQDRRTRPGLANARAALIKLSKHLADARDAVDGLPLGALEALVTATNSPLGQFRQDLQRQILSADTALDALRAQPHKARDDHRYLLALQVAIVFRDILNLKPSSTRDTDPKLKPGSAAAAYARVLRGTLKLAGWPQVDIGPLIDRGLVLLADPNGDKNIDIAP